MMSRVKQRRSVGRKIRKAPGTPKARNARRRRARRPSQHRVRWLATSRHAVGEVVFVQGGGREPRLTRVPWHQTHRPPAHPQVPGRCLEVSRRPRTPAHPLEIHRVRRQASLPIRRNHHAPDGALVVSSTRSLDLLRRSFSAQDGISIAPGAIEAHGDRQGPSAFPRRTVAPLIIGGTLLDDRLQMGPRTRHLPPFEAISATALQASSATPPTPRALESNRSVGNTSPVLPALGVLSWRRVNTVPDGPSCEV
jgi:hypothetical protein